MNKLQIIQRLTEAKRLADDLSNLTLRQQRCNASLDVDCVYISSAIDYALSQLLSVSQEIELPVSLPNSELAQSLESVPKVQAATPNTCPNCQGRGVLLFLEEECPLCCGSGYVFNQSIRLVPLIVPVNPDCLQD